MRFLISDFRLLISRKAIPINEALLARLIPYLDKLLQAFGVVQPKIENQQSKIKNLVEPLSRRELEVLHLIARGLSNREIGERLFLALDTVKGHNRRIFDKLQVHSRTEAIVRARDLGLL
jgi:LuxR family maltose regulon positive regulatory protein